MKYEMRILKALYPKKSIASSALLNSVAPNRQDQAGVTLRILLERKWIACDTYPPATSGICKITDLGRAMYESKRTECIHWAVTAFNTLLAIAALVVGILDL